MAQDENMVESLEVFNEPFDGEVDPEMGPGENAPEDIPTAEEE